MPVTTEPLIPQRVRSMLDRGWNHAMMIIMRYPESHKAEVRERIVRAAASALRHKGLSGVSVPALMKEAGLTHGGFYGYFSDRDALVAEAVLSAASDTATGVFAEGVPLGETLRKYLSEGHVAHPEQGCVVAALGSEGAHQSAPVRHAFAEVARGLLRLVEKKLRPKHKAPTPSDDALRLASTMVGAIVLARLVDDPSLSERIVHAARASHVD